MKKSLALAALGAAVLAASAPAGAQVVAQSAPCSNAAAVAAQLDAPASGATGVTLQPNRLDGQVLLPADGSVSVDQLRVMLYDGSSLATEAGVLALDPSSPAQLPPQMAIRTNPSAPAMTSRYVTTWVPGLKANTRYDVKLVEPSQNNCVYADFGSFTTGAE